MVSIDSNLSIHGLHWPESLNVYRVEKVAGLPLFSSTAFSPNNGRGLANESAFFWLGTPSVSLSNYLTIVICFLYFRLLTQMVERSQSQLKSLRWGSPWVIKTLIGKSHSLLDVLIAGMLCRRWTGRGRRNRWAKCWSVVWEQLSWWSLLSTDHRRSTATSTGESVRCESVDQLCKGVIIPPSFSLSSLPSPSLFSLLPSHSWNTLVHKNFEIEHACLDMERELYQLRQEAKERLVNVLVIVAALITHFFSL